MPKYLFIIFTIYCQLSDSKAQELEFLYRINQTCHLMAVDPLQQLYIVEATTQSIHKYSTEGKLLYTYSDNNLGKLTDLDAQNPMQVLSYWKAYNDVVILDRTLSRLAQFNLDNLGFYQVPAVCLSNDQHVWIYDPDNFRLVKIDAKGGIITESNDLSSLLNAELSVYSIIEEENRVYMNIPKLGILVFDNLGNYERLLNLKEVDFFQVYKENLFFIQKNRLKSYHFPSFQILDIPLEVLEADAKQIQLSPNYLFIRYPNKVDVYKIKK